MQPAMGAKPESSQSKREETKIEIRDAEKLSLVSYISSECCIFKVPSILYRHDKDAYEPTAFSFGPLHHGRDRLKATEKIKAEYLNALISRKPNPTPQKTLDSLIEAVKGVEGKARQCYDAVPLDLDQESLTDCLVLDGCFIIELLRKQAGEVPYEENDPVFGMRCMRGYLYYDLMMLENQIPWFVLELLFDKTSDSGPGGMSLTELVIEYFNYISGTELPIVNIDHGSKHILDLLRISLLSSWEEDQNGDYNGWTHIPSARDLKDAGIIFKKGNPSNLLNITFNEKNGILEIPTLKIDEGTNILFRNLISFEQCYPHCLSRFTSYAMLLDILINTKDDISVLQEGGIIENWLTPDDAVQFFNNLYKDTFVRFYYHGVCRKVREYCQRCWPRWRAAYIQNHFGKPWVIVSEVVAGIILLLTLLQTIFTIKNK